MAADEKLCVIELRTTADSLPIVEELLGGQGMQWASRWNPEAREAVVRVYCQDDSKRAVALRRMRALFEDCRELFDGLPPSVRSFELRREDWATVWKQHFHSFRASERLVVKPTWEPYANGAHDIVLELDPGMSFGTGYHGTTRACLEYLDELERAVGSVSLLDAGCGSGILSLAAAKLGYSPVVAFDHDADAACIARCNLTRAGAPDVRVFCADLGTVTLRCSFRMVVANILAPVLITHADRLVSVLDRSNDAAFLILSGILKSQYEEVRETFISRGLRERSSKVRDEWQTGCFALD
ncbi:MAG: 50S ribosomal protein L11 methyltransferase [Candidatus Pacebacteria bacterium]|nr:50S ribosomal protein L11 methyltransferase [Candidatus Paceibacterota bacterium]